MLKDCYLSQQQSVSAMSQFQHNNLGSQFLLCQCQADSHHLHIDTRTKLQNLKPISPLYPVNLNLHVHD